MFEICGKPKETCVKAFQYTSNGQAEIKMTHKLTQNIKQE